MHVDSTEMLGRQTTLVDVAADECGPQLWWLRCTIQGQQHNTIVKIKIDIAVAAGSGEGAKEYHAVSVGIQFGHQLIVPLCSPLSRSTCQLPARSAHLEQFILLQHSRTIQIQLHKHLHQLEQPAPALVLPFATGLGYLEELFNQNIEPDRVGRKFSLKVFTEFGS